MASSKTTQPTPAQEAAAKKKAEEKKDASLRREAQRSIERARANAQKELRKAAERALAGSGASDEKTIKAIAELIQKSKSFNINYHCLQLMQRDPFFCKVSQFVKKHATFELPTAALSFKNGDFSMYFNPVFMSSLTEEEVRGVLKHEFYHLVLGHINLRRRDNMQLWNIATDLAINSLIVKAGDKLPKQCLLPGMKPQKPPAGTKMTAEEKKANEALACFISQLPREMASEWYYSSIKKFCEENNIPTSGQCQACAQGIPRPMDGAQGNGKQKGSGDKQDGDGNEAGDQQGKASGGGHSHGDGQEKCDHGNGSGQGQQPGSGPPHTCGGVGGIGSFDDHGGWSEENSDASREYVDAKIKKIIGEAVRRADQSNSWGSVPAGMQAYLREKYSNQVNWKQLLRQFTGLARGTTRTPSMKVINRRYPYVHPGTKRGRTANIWVYVDQSGSVDDRSLELVFGELSNLARQMDITVFPFDYGIDEENAIKWRRGMKVAPKRTRSGGTSFDAVVDHLNKHKGMCDGALLLSDGECGQPPPAPCKFGYIIVPGRKLLFEPRPNEIHIQMKEESVDGEW